MRGKKRDRVRDALMLVDVSDDITLSGTRSIILIMPPQKQNDYPEQIVMWGDMFSWWGWRTVRERAAEKAFHRWVAKYNRGLRDEAEGRVLNLFSGREING